MLYTTLHIHVTRQAVPRNAGRVVCGNCDTPFVFKEHESAAAARSAWEGEVAALDADVEQAEGAYNAAIASRDKARLEVRQKKQYGGGVS